MRIMNSAEAQLHHLLKNENHQSIQNVQPANLPPIVGPTGIPLLDQMLSRNKRPEESSANARAVVPSNHLLPFQDNSILAVSLNGQVNDNSILKVGRTQSQFTYSKEQLLVFKKSPHSTRRPGCLDPIYNNAQGVWDPEIWISHCKVMEMNSGDLVKNSYSKTNTSNQPRHNQRRSGGDRTSIDSGFMSPTKRNSGYHESARRVGSGRLLLKDHDPTADRQYDFDLTMERTFSSEDAEEPEWFSSGPTSKHDMIELRGFEDIPEENGTEPLKESAPAKKTVEDPTANTADTAAAVSDTEVAKTDGETTPGESLKKKNGPKGRSTPTSLEFPETDTHHSPISKNNESQSSASKDKKDTGEKLSNEPAMNPKAQSANSPTAEKDKNKYQFKFNFDEFFQYDWSAVSKNNNNNRQGSRFKQWFKKRDNSQHSDHDSILRTSFQEEILNNILNDSVNSQSSKRKYEMQQRTRHLQRLQEQEKQRLDMESAMLFNMLHHNQQKQVNMMNNSFVANSFMPNLAQNNQGNIMSLQEIESRMQKGLNPTSHYGASQAQKSEKEISAFKNMLCQANSGQVPLGAMGLSSPKQYHQPSLQEQSLLLQQAANPLSTLVQKQIMDLVKNFWHLQTSNVTTGNSVNWNFAGQPAAANFSPKKSPPKLQHKDSTLYHRRVKFSDNL